MNPGAGSWKAEKKSFSGCPHLIGGNERKRAVFSKRDISCFFTANRGMGRSHAPMTLAKAVEKSPHDTLTPKLSGLSAKLSRLRSSSRMMLPSPRPLRTGQEDFSFIRLKPFKRPGYVGGTRFRYRESLAVKLLVTTRMKEHLVLLRV